MKELYSQEPGIKAISSVAKTLEEVNRKMAAANISKIARNIPSIKGDFSENPNVGVSLSFYKKLFPGVPSVPEILELTDRIVRDIDSLSDKISKATDVINSREYEKKYEIRYGVPPKDAKYTIRRKKKSESQRENNQSIKEMAGCLLGH